MLRCNFVSTASLVPCDVWLIFMWCTTAVGHHSGLDKMCFGLIGFLMLCAFPLLIRAKLLRGNKQTLSLLKIPDHRHFVVAMIILFCIGIHSSEIRTEPADWVWFSSQKGFFSWCIFLIWQISAPCPSPPTQRSSSRICKSCLSRFRHRLHKLIILYEWNL